MSSTKRISVAFSGSGFLAPLHVGAACAFLDSGYAFESVAGTSGGSMVAALVASGKTSAELSDLIQKIDFSKFLTVNLGSLLWNRSGYSNGMALFNFMDDVLLGARFKDMRIPLAIVATDLEKSKPFLFSQSRSPNTSVALACKASSAVPFVYDSVKHQGAVLVDGGLVNNIPLRYLKGKALKVGISVEDSSTNKIKGPISTAQAVITTLLSSNEGTQELVAKNEGASIISVSGGDVWFLDASLTEKQKTSLFQEGYSQVMKWLETR
jgi:NTE family protein